MKLSRSSTKRCPSRRPYHTSTVDSACSEDVGPCLKMAGVQPGPTGGPSAPVDPLAQKALDDLSTYQAELLEYSEQMDEIEGQLRCGTP
jgi:hypothetical protein